MLSMCSTARIACEAASDAYVKVRCSGAIYAVINSLK